MARRRKTRPETGDEKDAEEERQRLPGWLRTPRAKWGLGALGSAVAIVMVLLLLGPTVVPIPFDPEPGEPPVLPSGDEPPLLFEPEWNDCLEDYRPDYGLACEMQRLLFGDLPKAPEDLADRAFQYYFNRVTIERILQDHADTDAREYWMQPEWWPGWSETRLEHVRYPVKPNQTTFGFSFYNAARGLTLGQDSLDRGWAEIRTFLRGAWGIDTWQGFHVYPTYPEEALYPNGTVMRLKSGEPIVQDPEDIPFTVRITNPSHGLYMENLARGLEDDRREGGQFLLIEPNGADLGGFGPGWADMVTFRIELTTRNPEPGMYFFTVGIGNADREHLEEYYYQYGNLFVPAGDWAGFTTRSPLFTGLVYIPSGGVGG